MSRRSTFVPLAMALILGLLGGCASNAGPVAQTYGADGRLDAEPLTANEIEELLAGNTIIGEWSGESYRQFFDLDGSTIYAPRQARSTRGTWRVDPAANTYESLWGNDAEWEAYQVLQAGDVYFWAGEGVGLTPFEVVTGQDLVWPQ